MKKNENYLDRVAIKNPDIGWTSDDKGIVTLEKTNKGIANKLAQIILKKPAVSFIHLDEFGSFVWNHIDGVKDITLIGIDVKEFFGDKVEPLYERLAKFIHILSGYGFITFKK